MTSFPPRSFALLLHAQFGMADWNVNVGSNINSAPVVVNDPLLDFGSGVHLTRYNDLFGLCLIAVFLSVRQ